MKHLFPLLCVCIMMACSTTKQQVSSSENFPKLSYQQMLEDHDTLTSYIKQISPIIYYNKEVRGIDFEQDAKNLRHRITKRTTTAEFIQLVEKTLNVAQDGHTNRLGTWQLDVMKKFWLPSSADFVRGIDSASLENSYAYADYFKDNIYTKLDLNLVYTSGEYFNLLPFEYNNKYYPASMKLISCNGIEINNYVNKLSKLVSPLRWDRTTNSVYDEAFYVNSENYKNEVLKLVFLDEENNRYKLNISKNDTVTFLEKKNWKYGYNSDKDSLITHYFEKHGIFYAKIPMMKEELGDSIKLRLKSLIQKNKVNAVVVDIRGNGGGSDNTYTAFLKSVVLDTLKLDLVLGRNFSRYNQEYFKINKDSVINRKSHTFKVNLPTLKDSEMYYIQLAYNFVIPDSIKLPFHGKIYVLQDRYIYSSASNLSSLAYYSDQLVSIGQTPDLFGGLQTNPVVMMLPNSKVIFRVEPQIDLTNITNVSDIFQNKVEHSVPYSIDHLYLRTTTKKNIYGKDFLLHQDPMFKKVLELEN